MSVRKNVWIFMLFNWKNVRILMVFRSIVSQLAKPNEKFMYGAVREGGRARDFEEAIEWLVSAGMLHL